MRFPLHRRVAAGALALGALALLPTGVFTHAAQPSLSALAHVRVGDLNIGYREGGTGYPLVLVMGRGGTMADWDPQLLRTLMHRHHVVVFDNRGVATTDNPATTSLTVDQMAQDTAGLMQALGIPRADLLGWSMGGYIAQTVALRHPALVRRLVLAATNPGGPHAVAPRPAVAKALSDPHLSTAHLLSLSFPPDPAGLAAAAAYTHRILTQPGVTRASFTISTQAKSNQQAATGQWKSATGGDYAQLPTLLQPTLVADGRDDVIDPIGNSHLLASRIPHAHLAVYSNAGHAFLFQGAASFGQRVLTFLG